MSAGATELRIEHAEPSITITDGEGRTRRLQTTWKDAQVSPEGNEIRAFWKKEKLVVKAKRAADDRESTQKFEINEAGQLVVATTVSMGERGKLTFKRVYDRAETED